MKDLGCDGSACLCLLRAVTSLLDCSETSQASSGLDLASSFTTAGGAVEDKGLNPDLGHLPVSAPVLRVYQRRAATELEHEVSPHPRDVSRGGRLTGSCFPARLGSPSSGAQSQRSRTLSPGFFDRDPEFDPLHLSDDIALTEAEARLTPGCPDEDGDIFPGFVDSTDEEPEATADDYNAWSDDEPECPYECEDCGSHTQHRSPPIQCMGLGGGRETSCCSTTSSPERSFECQAPGLANASLSATTERTGGVGECHFSKLSNADCSRKAPGSEATQTSAEELASVSDVQTAMCAGDAPEDDYLGEGPPILSSMATANPTAVRVTRV